MAIQRSAHNPFGGLRNRNSKTLGVSRSCGTLCYVIDRIIDVPQRTR